VQATCVDCCWDGPYLTARRVDNHTWQSWNPKSFGRDIEKSSLGDQNDFLPGKRGYHMCTKNYLEALNPQLYVIFSVPSHHPGMSLRFDWIFNFMVSPRVAQLLQCLAILFSRCECIRIPDAGMVSPPCSETQALSFN
jgi:hypothetical protein